jgi:putative transposase
MANRIPIEVGEWYHCFNRGADKRKVFMDTRDYERFMLQMYLGNLPKKFLPSNLYSPSLPRLLNSDRHSAFVPLVEIGAYCLMPNHVHFVLKEVEQGGIATFMQKVFTGYTMYFNKKNERSGALFAGSYKSKHLSTDRYFKHAINYVHMNPVELYEPNWKQGAGNVGKIEEKLRSYKYSSLPDHIGIERIERRLLGNEVFALFDAPTSLSTMLFEAQAYYRESASAE